MALFATSAWGENVVFEAGTSSGKFSQTTTLDNHAVVKLVTNSTGGNASSRQIWKDGGTAKNETAIQMSSAAGNDPSSKYIEISVTEGHKITGVIVRGANGGSTSATTYNAFCFAGSFSTDEGAVTGLATLVFPGYGGTSDGANVSMTGIVDGTRTIRIYKQVKYNSTTKTIGNVTGANNIPSSVSNANVAKITVTYETVEDETAPQFVSSTPANGATGVATSGTIVLTFDEAVASVDGAKFTLTNATKGTVAIDGTDSKKVNIPYSGADELEVVTLSVAAEAVADAAGNKSAALSDISFTTDGTCTNPTITTNLSTTLVEYLKDADATPLAIVATGKSLTYQWYSNTTNSTEGATSLGETARSASYTPSTATVGTTYYYCVVSSGDCSTTSAIAQIKVSYARTTGWVIYDGLTDESFTSGSIEYNTVTVSYTVAGNSMLDAAAVTSRNTNNDFNELTYPYAVKINKNDGSSTGYVSFTIPSGYQLTKIIFALAYAGGGRNVVLAKSAVTSTDSEDVIKSLHTGGNSDRIYDATYQPASAIAAGTYYICSPVGGSWNIFHLQLVLETTPSTDLDNTMDEAKAVKVLRNGQLFIEKNGKTYNAMGVQVQ